MPKPRIVLFSGELRNCPCYDTIFNSDFETASAASETDFLASIRQKNADAAIVCLCSADKEGVDVLVRLHALSGPLPVLVCSRSLNPHFVQTAARQGVNRFLRCTMRREEIQDVLFEAIQQGGLREWLESCYPGSLDFSPCIRRLIDEIVHTFPHRVHENEMARRLGISQSWLQKLCRRAFRKSYTRLIRRIRVHQALRLMNRTALDNTEIALHLNYSEESSLARDFRKESGYTPSAARQLLARRSPEELLL